MSDERDTADFIKSLFRVSGLGELDLEDGEDWMTYSSGIKVSWSHLAFSVEYQHVPR